MINLQFLLMIILFSILSFHESIGQNEDEEISNILENQSECWNNGNIRCFMKYYWNSDKLKFIGKNGVTYGWQQTYDNYLTRYPDRKTMGTLTFEIMEKERLSPDAYLVVGKFHLKRDEDIGDASGYFTLIFRKMDGEWLIVTDHTSA